MNEIVCSKYLNNEDFNNDKEIELFNHLMFEAKGGFSYLFHSSMEAFFGWGREPTFKNTQHEVIFANLFPFLKKQVTFGTGKGGYKEFHVKKYTVDFYNSDDNVVWEIDGESHKTELQKLKDSNRDLILKMLYGITTYRLTNEDVERILLERIRNINLAERVTNGNNTEKQASAWFTW